ncbi:hypothetical protein ACIA49_38830 [Kribbella sp. NPDC051587]|uniref:hypothetical protein n=1 Tax=Kribbella sp. NPDC051587 TaxID=3364119 RepID=UPI0037B32629
MRLGSGRHLRLVPVVDRRTFRKAARRVDANLDAGDFIAAWTQTVAITTWLTSERHYGRKRRREWMQQQLATWQARREEYRPAS